jgi:AcrR family transcriptional regulator
MSKQTTKRLSRQERNDTLIKATFECVAEKGLDGTTIRDIADYAGVTFGLIRHYFANKEELIEATYSTITAEMTRHAQVAAAHTGPDPAQQLRAFIAASLSEPFVSPQYLAFWSSFIGKILVDPHMKELHREGFLEYRMVLTDLVGKCLTQAGRSLSKPALELEVIKVNSIIDGFWIEACLDVPAAKERDLVGAGVAAVEAVLGLRLDLAET